MRCVWVVLAWTVLVASGCCPSPTGDVLVVNNTDAAVTFAFADGSADTEVAPGRLGMLSGDPGQVTVVVSAEGHELGRRDLTTTLEAVSVSVADPSRCLAIVDYTRQFSDEAGPVDLLAVVGPPQALAAADPLPTTLTYGQLTQIYGPDDEIPAEVYPNAIVRRATPVNCELLADREHLINTLARLP